MGFRLGDVVVAAIGGILAFVGVIWAIPFIIDMGLWSAGTSTGLTNTVTAYESAIPFIGILLGIGVFAGVMSSR